MPDKDPCDAITSLEVLLRELIRSTWGADWLAKSGLDAACLEEKRDQEQGKRRGIFHSKDLINYTDFSQLTRMILASKNWTDFSGALGSKKYIEIYFNRLNALRNPAMHSRTLYPFERDLVSGITGEISNLLVIYRSERGPDLEYYPIITLSHDSLGHDDSEIGTASGGYQVETNRTLPIGAPISFHFEASDPANRRLTWTARVMRMNGVFVRWLVQEAVGTTFDFSWIVEGTDSGRWAGVYVTVAAESEYHRHHQVDDRRYYWYTVNPPKPKPVEDQG